MALNEEETRRIVEMTVRESVPHVVRETLTNYGIDAANPIEVQKDQQHLRKWRVRLDTVGGRIFMAMVMIVAGFGSQMLGAGIVDWIRNLPT